LALQWHPDKNHEPGAEEMFIMINEAFGVLGDEELKRRYPFRTLPFMLAS
jgi:DnaJ-class molecular chaperone